MGWVYKWNDFDVGLLSPKAVAARGRSQPRHVEMACAHADEETKINRVNSKSKLLKSPENNFDIDIFINPKESVSISPIYSVYQYRR